jgi:hypothetical protein
LSSSWYPVIPATPHTAISGRSRHAGLRTPSAGRLTPSAGLRTRSSAPASASAASAAEATTSRATASPAAPSPATATVIAGNALAHSTTVPVAARFASLLMKPSLDPAIT